MKTAAAILILDLSEVLTKIGSLSLGLCLLGLLFVFAARRYGRKIRTGSAPISYRDFQMQFAEIDGLRIRYHRSGRGPFLVLIHGLGANLLCWRLLVPFLREEFTIVALDLPGFGQSSIAPQARYGLDDQIPRVLAFFDQQKIESAYVVGNSMGGNIALWLALTHPERVRGCAVIAPATSPNLEPIGVHRLTWLSHPISSMLTRSAMGWAYRRAVSNPELIDAHRIEETFHTYGGQGEAVRSFLKATTAIRDKRLPGALKGLEKKVLILWGSADRIVPKTVIDGLAAVLPSYESHVHIGGGHHLQEDEPAWVAERLAAFFQHSS